MTRVSLSDGKIREELQRGREALLSDESSRSLLSALRRAIQSITPNLYILKWIPEQGEDLYDLLVDGKAVVRIEIPRVGGDDVHEIFRVWTIEEYVREKTGMTKPERRRLEIALALAANDKLDQ